jgi:hypothetical protein
METGMVKVVVKGSREVWRGKGEVRRWVLGVGENRERVWSGVNYLTLCNIIYLTLCSTSSHQQ